MQKPTLQRENMKKVGNFLMPKLSKTDRQTVISLMGEFKKFQTRKMTLEELDEILLFTPNKPKEVAYRLEESMYVIMPYPSVRSLIEVSDEPLHKF